MLDDHMTQTPNILSGFAQKRPAVFMVIATYVWTWSFWFSSLNLGTRCVAFPREHDWQRRAQTRRFVGG